MALATGISHAAVIVTDVDRAKDFYVNFLGLQEIPRPERIKIPGAWLQCANGHQVHLIGDANAQNVSGVTSNYRPHLALHIEDIDLVVEKIKARGLNYRLGEVDGAHTATIDDPDGNSIELTTR